jgi:hypothetical protein
MVLPPMDGCLIAQMDADELDASAYDTPDTLHTFIVSFIFLSLIYAISYLRCLRQTHHAGTKVDGQRSWAKSPRSICTLG